MDIDKLKELKTLLDEKVITKDEFEKAKIINNNETFEPEVKKPKGKGIASMVLGILAVIFSLSALGGIEENFAELFYRLFSVYADFRVSLLRYLIHSFDLPGIVHLAACSCSPGC